MQVSVRETDTVLTNTSVDVTLGFFFLKERKAALKTTVPGLSPEHTIFNRLEKDSQTCGDDGVIVAGGL